MPLDPALQSQFPQLIFDLFPSGAAANQRPKDIIQAAASDGANFTARKFARAMLELTEAERPAIALVLMNLISQDSDKKIRLLPYLKELIQTSSATDYDTLIHQAFGLKFVELYESLLSRQGAQPSSETWELIWPQVLATPKLLNEVLSRFGSYKTPPPSSIDLLVDPSSQKLNKNMVQIAKNLLVKDPEVTKNLWSMFLNKSATLAEEDRDQLLALVAQGDISSLITNGFASQLTALFENSKNLKLRAFRSLWDKISYLPVGRLERLAEDPEYQQFLSRAFDVILTPGADENLNGVANFLAHAINMREAATKHQEWFETAIKNTTNSGLRDHLKTILRNLPAPADHVALEREKLKGERLTLEAEKRQLQEREIENSKLKSTTDVAMMQSQIVILQAEFQTKMAEIQSSLTLSPEEKSKAMQVEATILQNKIKELTKS